MSILIKGMGMPRSCHSCCFFGQAYIWESDFDGYTKSFCKRTGSQTFDYVENFLPNCPLVPIPPHGRLIDADAIINSRYEIAILEALGDAPTIIPAEEECCPNCGAKMDGGNDDD